MLICLKIKLGATYRELVDWLGEMPGIQQVLGLGKLPHFTTVQKAFVRLSPAVWRVVQRASSALLPTSGLAALDASGWDRSYASRHYTQRLKLQIRSLKTTLLVDTHAQMVLDVHVTATRRHDTRIAPQLGNLERFHTLAADKGYDDQGLRGWLRGQGKRPVIRHREFAPWRLMPAWIRRSTTGAAWWRR